MIRPDDPALNLFFVNGVSAPGAIEVVGAAEVYKWQKREPSLMSAAHLRGSGPDLCPFSVRFILWEQDHFDAWPAFAAILRPPPRGVRPTRQHALRVSHPILADVQITDAVVVKRPAPLPEKKSALWVAQVDFLQWGDPTPRIIRPRGGIDGVDAEKVEVQTAADRALAAERAKIDARAGR